ncbi:MAG: class I SAM-dependent methyltransferase, partial [Pseudomonadota bacterium]
MTSKLATLPSHNTLRFKFGANWANFLKTLNNERIQIAEQSIKDMLKRDDLKGLKFLDIGSGSGLFSLCARHLGATVYSFDYDINSVECTRELKRRYFPDDAKWTIEQGSALDRDYLKKLGQFDVIYSWGVLHHTGDMWQALERALIPAANKSQIAISIYNDQGRPSRNWTKIKQLYNALPKSLRFVITIPCLFRLWGLTWLRDLFK